MKKSASTPLGAEQRELVWNKLNSSSAESRVFKLGNVYRAKVPGGWLVLLADNARGLTFYPTPSTIGMEGLWTQLTARFDQFYG